LLQFWVGVQRGHFTGSLMAATVQVGASRMLTVPPVGSGKVQQPKQSHPFGV